MTHKTKLLGSVQGIVDQAKLLPLGSSSIGKFTTIAELLFSSVARKLHFKLYVYIVETLKNKKNKQACRASNFDNGVCCPLKTLSMNLLHHFLIIFEIYPMTQTVDSFLEIKFELCY